VSSPVERPQEEACLFNPAFLGLELWFIAAGYSEQTGKGIPFELAFVALPLSLHRSTREALPHSIRTSLAAWLEDNTDLRVGFPDRARGLAPFVREAILFGSAHGLLAVAERGRLLALPMQRPLKHYLSEATEEVRNCLLRAEFVGRWFGVSGTSTTIMSLWGVTP